MPLDPPEDPAEPPASDDPDDGRRRTIADNMANLYRLHFGRTPEDVRVSFVGGDVVLVLLEGSMSRAERRLVQAGRQQDLREARLAVQHGSADQFRNIVAAATGRRVCAFTSGHDVDADVASELFVLEDE